MAEILPPTSDEVKFYAVALKLSPAAHAKVEARQRATGLTRAKLYSALLETAHAALDGDSATLEKWTNYYHAVVAAKKAGT